MSLIGRYNSYRPIETISDRYLFIGFIGISLSADIVIGRYQKNLYRAYSSTTDLLTDMIKVQDDPSARRQGYVELMTSVPSQDHLGMRRN